MAENSKNEIKLEAAMARLDEIVRLLSEDKGDLDAALRLYEEGIGLCRACNKSLEEAERRIRAVKISSEGEITEEDFIKDGKAEE